MDPLANSVAVRTTSVSKRYGSTDALAGISISVQRGSVYGLVGPNGAGKTTLLSLLAGLRSPTAGTLEITATRVRVLPDTPLFDRWLTGREVVALSAGTSSTSISENRIDEVLDTAGLAEAKDRRVAGYSRGMLQRLGLASTVVTEPELILLDEPAAALDPRGRREVLDLVADLRGHSTVIFSSHILDDVEEVCDAIGILVNGSLVYEGSLERLLAIRGTDRTYRIESDDPAGVLDAIRAQEWVSSAEDVKGSIVVIGTEAGAIQKAIVPFLGGVDATIIGVTPVRKSLEDVFLEVTR